MNELTQQIKDLEQSLLQRHTRSNEAYLNSLLHDEFEELGESGKVVTKWEAIEWLLREADGVQWSLSNFRIKSLSDELVLAIYIACKSDLTAGTDKRSLRSSVWKKTATSWALLFHQGTSISSASP